MISIKISKNKISGLVALAGLQISCYAQELFIFQQKKIPLIIFMLFGLFWYLQIMKLIKNETDEKSEDTE